MSFISKFRKKGQFTASAKDVSAPFIEVHSEDDSYVAVVKNQSAVRIDPLENQNTSGGPLAENSSELGRCDSLEEVSPAVYSYRSSGATGYLSLKSFIIIAFTAIGLLLAYFTDIFR